MKLEKLLDYSSPSVYHFTEDSIILAKYAAERISTDIKVLDMCAGCGVVGLEFYNVLKKTSNIQIDIDFLELQQTFIPYLAINIDVFGKKQFSVINSSIKKLGANEEYKNGYDLILCNPPYFEKGEGKLSSCTEKNICRVFMEDSYQDLLESIKFLLSKNGKAYVLIRTDVRKRIELASKLFFKMNLNKIGKNRAILSLSL